MKSTNMETIETHDIQGLITKGYSELPACKFLLLSITDKEQAKQWLKSIIPDITPGNEKLPPDALNIAFTYQGLKELGLSAESLDTFPIELEDGMTTPHKQLFLGDFGSSAPEHWEWGGKNNAPVHILLMIYASNDGQLDGLYSWHRSELDKYGLQEIKQLDTTVLNERKEHFGFHDGIAQPTIKGLKRQDAPENTVAPGEFILGYKNSYGQYPGSPSMTVGSGMCDLGKNGSYLVFRQMEQDVALFWKYMDKSTTTNGTCNAPEMIKLASKMMGRWPSGAPVTVCPEKDVAGMESKDDFGYRVSDNEGLKCPVASHIRRTNPRDTLDTNSKASVEISNKHRILRRGRSYGTPVCESLAPEEILKAKNIEGKRGLHFICINADIGRQFEFIQNAWVNNPKFLNLYDERDPIIGNNLHPEDPNLTGSFSTPAEGLRKRYTDIPQFTTVKGGAYFFMPGIKVLTYLSSI